MIVFIIMECQCSFIVGMNLTQYFQIQLIQECFEVCKGFGILRCLVRVNWHVPVENLNGGRNRFILERN